MKLGSGIEADHWRRNLHNFFSRGEAPCSENVCREHTMNEELCWVPGYNMVTRQQLRTQERESGAGRGRERRVVLGTKAVLSLTKMKGARTRLHRLRFGTLECSICR